MYSMTGYGKGVSDVDGNTLTIEIKSVNHRFLDLCLKMPKSFLFLEDSIKKAIGAKIQRGHLDIFVTYEQKSVNFGSFSADVELAKNYIAMADKLAKETGLENDLTLSSVLKVQDMVLRSTVDVDEKLLAEKTLEALNIALDGLLQMRCVEGQSLKNDILLKLNIIEEKHSEICDYAPFVVDDYRNKLYSRIKDAIGADMCDNERLATEVALYADHCAIDEETTRLKAHIENMKNLLDMDEPVGRKLDFLVQELNRETNTIGSKANDLRITNNALAIKNEIEKIREQAQNIE